MAIRIGAALANHPDESARRWSYRELTRAVIGASGVQISEDTGRTWMSGSQPRDPRVAAALADVLCVTAGWLYFGEPPIPDFAQLVEPPLTAATPPAERAARRNRRGEAS